MDDVREATEDLLADKPEAESALEEILTVDEDGSWTFGDLAIDSGTFGEIVSRGIVEDSGDGYRVVDPAAVRAAVTGEPVEQDNESEGGFDMPAVSLPEVDRQTVLVVGGALAFVALVRIVFMWSSVFRGSDIVLAGNDPYYYRYWVDTLLGSELQAFDFGSLTELPQEVANGDVFLIVVLWWAASLIGSGQTASGLVVAWYPVIAAVISAALLYLLTVVVTNDRRIGFAAVVTLALTPAHAFRSALGFGDHHAFDFVWLALVGLSLVLLTTESEERGWPDWLGPLAGVGLGIGVTAQITAWRGGPILVLPIAAYVVLKVVDDVRADRSPLIVNRWLGAGLVLSGLLTLFTNGVFGWLGTYRSLVPALLAGGTVGMIALGEVYTRFERSAREFGAVTAVLSLAGVAALQLSSLALWSALQTFWSFLTAQSEIAETQSLISGGLGSVFLLGLFLFLALPYIAIATWRVYQGDDPAWLVCVVFTWSLLVLSVFQLRFAGELSLFVALFAGAGFVYLAEKLELARPAALFTNKRLDISIPSTETIGQLGVLFLLFASMGVIQTPVKMSQITIDEGTYETATAINEYAEQENVQATYVFSNWGRNRVYNYFVSGQSRSYGYAEVLYGQFLRSTDLEGWYERLSDRRAGFVVVETETNESGENRTVAYNQLSIDRSNTTVPAVSHYRMIHIGSDQQAYELVPGATLVGQTVPNESVTVSTTVAEGGRTYDYTQTVQSTRTGWYTATVPYPGAYTVQENTTMVTESDVDAGELVTDPEPYGNWSLNSSEGDVAFDSRGGNHGHIEGANWTEGYRGSGLRFSEGTYVEVPDDGQLSNGSFTLSVRYRTDPSVDYTEDVRFPGLVSNRPATNFVNTSGYMIGMVRGNVVGIVGNGSTTRRITGPRVDDGEWHRSTLVWNGTHTRLYTDDQLVGTSEFDGEIRNDDPLVIGSSAVKQNSFVGTIDEIALSS